MKKALHTQRTFRAFACEKWENYGSLFRHNFPFLMFAFSLWAMNTLMLPIQSTEGNFPSCLPSNYAQWENLKSHFRHEKKEKIIKLLLAFAFVLHLWNYSFKLLTEKVVPFSGLITFSRRRRFIAAWISCLRHLESDPFFSCKPAKRPSMVVKLHSQGRELAFRAFKVHRSIGWALNK